MRHPGSAQGRKSFGADGWVCTVLSDAVPRRRATGCPVAEQLPAEAAVALRRALPDLAVDVKVVWDPPWTPERLAPEALDTLGWRPR